MKRKLIVRYAYGITSALLLTGSAVALTTGQPLGAQVAQNDESAMRARAPTGAPMSFADLTEQLQPAVVNISTKQKVRVSNNPFAGTPFADLFGNRRGGGGGDQTREAQSLGSGFIISADGYVATNNHVVSAGGNSAKIESITVTMPDGKEYDAKLVGSDPQSDLAVLKITRSEPFPFVKFGDSTRTRVGDWIIAIGNPFSLGGTVTSGIISAVYRNTGQGGAYDRYLQTDASINSGNSGGPMFDLNGNVIGINNAIISPNGGSVGIGFAIPAEVAAPIIEKLKSGERIERGFLGVALSPLNEGFAESLGLPKNRGELIQSVVPGQAADKAGLKAGDVVVKAAGKDVTLDQNLSFIVANVKPGTRIPIELIRNGDRQRITATVGQRPSEDELAETMDLGPGQDFAEPDEQMTEQAAQELLGVAVIEMTPQIARRIGVPVDTQGVVVRGVDPSSNAGQLGFQPGFVILSINNMPTTTPGDLNRIVANAKQQGRDSVLVRVQRGNSPAQFVPVRLRNR